MFCVDNSEYMRNGDYIPNRLLAQQDAINTVARFKLRSNPENSVGLITLSDNANVVSTLTTDVGKLMTSLHKINPGGDMNLSTGLRVAHLALKHRMSRIHKMRVVVFVGSPITLSEREIVRLGRKLKKEGVNIDVVNFGETEKNTRLLEMLVDAINDESHSDSHLVTIPAPCSHLSDALLSSPVMAAEEGGANPAQFASGNNFEFGVDPNEDPELALALRVSMEEQRQRQQEGTSATTEGAADAPAAPASGAESTAPPAPSAGAASDPAPSAAPTSEEEMLQQALALSMEPGPATQAAPASGAPAPAAPDFSNMTEEEQIAYAMQISMAECEPMEVDASSGGKSSANEDKSSGDKDESSS